MSQKIVTAGFVIIGDEILSGRTRDENLNFLALGLAEIGVNLREVRVVPDVEVEIIEALNSLRKKFDYVFTSGGVGPTHDDITSATIAKAFDDELIKNQDAEALLTKYYGAANMNEARLRMAFMPSKARLVENSIDSVSGFRIENVFVFAGIPRIFKEMFNSAKKQIIGGAKTKSVEIKISLTESFIAKDFANLQQKYSQVTMGSYPAEGSTSLVFRGIDYDLIEKSVSEMIEILKNIKADSVVGITRY